MKKAKLVIPTLILCTALVGISPSVKQKVDQQKDDLSNSTPLVKGADFQISKDDIVFYKSNLEMIKNISKDKTSIASDDELINEMIKKELTVSYAKKAGIKVSPQEVSDVIAKERAAIEDPNYSDENNETVKEIMRNRIRITGLSADDFWNSMKVKDEYEKALLLGKLYDQLLAQGKIKNAADFDVYQSDLLNSGKHSVSINKD